MSTAMNTETNQEMNPAMKEEMNNPNELVNRYFAVWNETDALRRRELIAQTWTEDATYLDPLMRAEGHTGIDALVQGVQERFSGLRFRQLNNVDAHNNHLRFSWELAPEGGAMLAAGTDFATVAGDGRLQAVTGFLDHVPAHS